ncbi:hypothetical protein Tco_0213226 [Tanacetum coccineum]
MGWQIINKANILVYHQISTTLSIFVDILKQIRWPKSMFSLLLLQDLTNRFFLSMHGYLLERETFSWIYKDCKRILSSASQLTFYTNFFRAFTASANVPTIYIQQFWNTLVQVVKTGTYNFQLDEHWFTLNADLFRKALKITPVDTTHPFVSPPAGDQVMDFVNDLSYPEEIHFVSKMHVNNLYQPWRAILTSVGRVRTSYQIFFAHRANLNIPTKKTTPHVIPYCQFTKLIIYYLGSEHNLHRRPGSPVHVTGDDFLLGNLKLVPKGEKDEVFGKPIPKELITEAIKNSPYYQQYLEMVARKPTAKKGEQKKTTSKADKPKNPAPAKQPTLAEQTKLVKEKTSKPSASKKFRKGKVMKVRKEKSLESFQAPVGGVAICEPASGLTQRLPVVEGKGKGIAIDEQVAQSLLELQKPKKQSTTDQYIFQRRIPVTQDAPTRPSAQPKVDTSTNVVRHTPSPADAETGANTKISNSEGNTKILNVDEERGENVSNTVALEENTVDLDEGQAGSDPGNTHES